MITCKDIGTCFGDLTEGLRMIGNTRNVSKTTIVMTQACIHECIIASMDKRTTNYAQITEDIYNISKQKDIFLRLDNLNSIERAHSLDSTPFSYDTEEANEILTFFDNNLVNLILLVELNLIKDNCPTLDVGYQMTMDVAEFSRQCQNKFKKLLMKNTTD